MGAAADVATTRPDLSTRTIPVVVRRKWTEALGVAALELQDPAGVDLPTWEPGAHVGVHLPDGSEKHYSLCGDPGARDTYRIAVLHQPQGRGGSTFVHDGLDVGDLLQISLPRNHFALVPAQRYRFVAGGIGITPLLPMIREVDARSADWSLTYLGRSRGSMAFLGELARFGDRVRVLPSEEGPVELAAVLGATGGPTQVYACGPPRLLEGVATVVAGWPGSTLRVERFTPSGVLEEPGTGSGEKLVVRLQSSRRDVEVPAGVSVLEAVEAAGVDAPFSCREGTCGTCETRIVAGSADHRDDVLSEDEKAADETMMICVSRPAGPGLVLDL
jgi:ferredoxin-NADP reductase